jgi:adenosylcobinamide-GDP ribazoletransferase
MASVVVQAKAALGCLTAVRKAATGASRETLAASLAFYPPIGLLLGAVAAAATAPFGRTGGPLAVLLLWALEGGGGPRALAAAVEGLARAGDAEVALDRLRARPGLLGVLGASVLFAVKLWAAAVLAAPARTPALLLAPLLGAWAVVVQCYGGSPVRARGVAAALVGRARFQEFGWASTVAFAVTLGLGEAVGLAVLVVAALATLALRGLAYRRVGGLTGRLLAATRELVETVVFVVLALLGGTES